MLDYKKKIPFDRLAQELTNVSEKIEKLKLPKGFLNFLLYTFSELFSNVKEHSRANTITVAINVNQRSCSLTVADTGVGFRKSYLLNKIYPKDDFAAIEFALSGLSTKDPQERGFGLYSTKKFVEQLHGNMILKSGVAQATIQKNTISFAKNPKKIRGVSIYVRVPVRTVDFYKGVE